MKILCLGDSLTTGWYKYGCAAEPYGEHVEEAMTNVEVISMGFPGASTARVYRNFLEATDGDISDYDTAVILTGTNDISQCRDGDMRPAETTVAELHKIYNTFLKKNIKVVPVTVPPFAAHESDCDMTKCRNIVNNEIRKFASDNKLPVVEFHDAILKEDSESYYDDNVHMSPVGYQLLARLVIEQLTKL